MLRIQIYPYEGHHNVLPIDCEAVSKFKKSQRLRRTNVDAMDEKALCCYSDHGLNDISSED